MQGGLRMIQNGHQENAGGPWVHDPIDGVRETSDNVLLPYQNGRRPTPTCEARAPMVTRIGERSTKRRHE